MIPGYHGLIFINCFILRQKLALLTSTDALPPPKKKKRMLSDIAL